jgi:transcriptional regulator with XRE-family HTH domain
MVDMTKALGGELAAARRDRGLSLEAVARPAKISPAYLHKLESGRVSSPSPRVLERLGRVLETPYATLMERAGYLWPAANPALGSDVAAPTGASEGPEAATNERILALLQDALGGIAELRATQQRVLDRLPPTASGT